MYKPREKETIYEKCSNIVIILRSDDDNDDN